MTLLHDYIADQLSRRVAKRRVVVWFDPRREFIDFVDELERVGDNAILVDGSQVDFRVYSGSFFELRLTVEPVVGTDTPSPTVLYLPGVERDHNGSVLMELECAGDRWEPQLKRLARNALRTRFTDGVIDDLLSKDNVTYLDVVAASDTTEGTEAPSILKTILGPGNSESMLARWLLNESLDGRITEKQAKPELIKLARARLDQDLDPEAPVSKLRSAVGRFVLATEFRTDLTGSEPDQLRQVPAAMADAQRNARDIASKMRAQDADAYARLADTVEQELGLASTEIDPLNLGSIDTFRFEERALLTRCYELIRDREYPETESVILQRRGSFWLDLDVERQAHWEVCRRMVELATTATRISGEIQAIPDDPDSWIEKYAEEWFALDQAQRRLEALIPKLEEEPDLQALVSIRNLYDEVLVALAAGFVDALDSNAWSVARILQQTQIYDDVVRPLPGRVAYLLVDAMRYEMGVELKTLLEGQGEVSLRPALSVLPSITVTGMAALMPGAASSYSVVADGGTLGARIDSKFLSGIKDRQRHVEGRIPSSIDVTLGDVLMSSRKKLDKKLGDAQTIIVRSQEIDAFGEAGFEARQIMSTVIENIARAVRKLASLGFESAVITADHGHLYSAEDRAESQRIESPGGDKVELHRRAWIGRGGSTPSASIRVSASKLGNDTDLDFVFPIGLGVFKAGGDLAFHHGGPTLQEMVIPHTRSAPSEPGVARAAFEVTGEPEVVTNRIFSVVVSRSSLFGAGQQVVPVLISEGRQVGSVGMVVGATHDPSTGTVTLPQSGVANLGFVLEDETATSLQIVILDPTTDAELYRSPTEIAVNLGVA